MGKKETLQSILADLKYAEEGGSEIGYGMGDGYILVEIYGLGEEVEERYRLVLQDTV